MPGETVTLTLVTPGQLATSRTLPAETTSPPVTETA